MVARSAPWPSSPAPSARREAAVGLDRSARPSRLGSHAANGYLRCLAASKVRHRRVNATGSGLLKTYTACGNLPLSSSHIARGGEGGKARRRFFLLFPPPHPPDDFVHRSGSAGKRDVFRAGTVWHLAMSAKPRPFPLVMRSRVVAGLAEWHGHTVWSHCGNVPSKYLNGTISSRCLKHGQQTVIPVSFSAPQPRHTVSVRALSSSASSSPFFVASSEAEGSRCVSSPPLRSCSSISCSLPQPEQMHSINVCVTG